MLMIVQLALPIVILALVGWRLRRQRAPILRAVSITLATLAIALFFVEHAAGEGDALCLDCGRVQHAVRVVGVPVPFTSRELELLSAGAAFVHAFPAELPEDHAHRWERVGCTRSGVFLPMVSCRSLGYPAWFRDLTVIDDRALAAATVAKYVSLTRHQQVQLLNAYPGFLGSASEQQFQGWRARWKPNHPDWP